MTEPKEKMRPSDHAGGHALASWAFGFGVGAVSIRPGRAHLGVMLGDGSARNIILGGHPLDGLDPGERQLADRALVQILAGDEAADLFMPRTGRQPDPPGYIGDIRATLDAVAPPGGSSTPLEPAMAARLEAAEADENPLDDYTRAQDLAYRVVGPTWALYVAWARGEARILARDHAAAIHALAAALRASEVLDGADAVAILQAHERSTE
jgi:hypothetical protein